MTRRIAPPREPLLPRLDDHPGPMPPLSAAEADAVAWAAVSRWAARPPGLDPADDAPGPSQPLTAEGVEELARKALRAHAQRQLSRRALAPGMRRAAAVALCIFGAAGVSFAALRLWPARNDERHESQPAAMSGKPIAAAEAMAEREPSSNDTPQVAQHELDAHNGSAAHSSAAAAVRVPVRSEPQRALAVDCDALLARANALRAKRDWVAAEATYRQVLAADASASQRYVALVAAAAIARTQLEKPARALRLYQSALALMPDGNLDEEALYGLAASQRALGNPAAERRTLERLLKAHPSGIYSPAAERRLAELQAPQ